MDIQTCLLHQLREMQRELRLAIEGLSDQQLTTIPPGHNNHIAWIVQHCCYNADFWLTKQATGNLRLDHAQRFVEWPRKPPQPGEQFPALSELLERWDTAAEAGIQAIQSLPEQQWHERGQAFEEAIIESCLRVINHQNAHLRQIWMILGYLQQTENKWPTQGRWLANTENAD